MPSIVGTPSLAEVVQDAIETGAQRLGVALPGVVVSFDAGTRTATVKPGVNRLVPLLESADEDEAEELPAIQNVPVCWPIARGFRLDNVTLAAGDPVLLICCDRDISAWRRSGAVSDPDDARVHSWSSAVAVPGLLPATNPIPAPGDAAALASKVNDRIDALQQKLDSLIDKYNTHQHANHGVPTVAPWLEVELGALADVDSDILKVSS